MHVHVLGIGGTLMGSLALLAKEMGHTVSGCDTKLYPPMSDQLAMANITVIEGYDPACLTQLKPDCIVVGNAISRGNPVLEAVLEQNLAYTSAPAWLSEHLLRDRLVLAFAGTHGKTTTTSMAAWILEQAGLNPGFLIGGVPNNWGHSSQLGKGRYFVIEADEYDTAFFDKRPKFMHYHPHILTLLNAEFDHADIYPDLASILQQFHYGIRLVPPQGTVIHNLDCPNSKIILEKGCWSQQISVGLQSGEWHVQEVSPAFDSFIVYRGTQAIGKVQWDLLGQHNVSNALAALAACCQAGVPPRFAVEALSSFSGVKRRMSLIGNYSGIQLFEDFAHHPTAIATTLEGVKAKNPHTRLVAALDFRSNTMKAGKHSLEDLYASFAAADEIHIYRHPHLTWDVGALMAMQPEKIHCFSDTKAFAEQAAKDQTARTVVLCSNGSFDGLSSQLAAVLDRAGAHHAA
jgi:UDP-N-acetylmuramate: L-alanyl-gamma-D-glutamyl-meso-diaminopimelate ligase